MKAWSCWLLALVLAAPGLTAMGFSEDPGEQLKRTYNVGSFQALTVRGGVQVEVRQGESWSLTVATNRALFDQLTVSNWFGSASVAIETGLRGPREAGTVQLWVTVPSLSSLTLLGDCQAVIDWPSTSGVLILRDTCTADLSFTGRTLRVEAWNHSRVSVVGSSTALDVLLRNGSRLEAADFPVSDAKLELAEGSVAHLGPTLHWEGALRHGSTATSAGAPPIGALATR